ncbi:hypothetical protein DV737_g5655, partial [Chaetothyriales sp. CBS 132003]
MAKFFLRALVAASSLSLLVSLATAQTTATSTTAATGAIETLDCYNAIPSDYTSKGAYTFQTSGYCQDECSEYPVMAITAGSTCYCGDELPSDSNKASSDNCDTPCQGYDTQTGLHGAKSETSSTTDQRLDPTFSMHRRNSLGSIADEQDFSRRILQVRNPDRDSRVSNLA